MSNVKLETPTRDVYQISPLKLETTTHSVYNIAEVKLETTTHDVYDIYKSKKYLIKDGVVIAGDLQQVEQGSPGEFYYYKNYGCIVFTGWCKLYQQVGLDFSRYKTLVLDIETSPKDWWGLDVSVGNGEQVPYWLNLPDTNERWDLINTTFQVQYRKNYTFNIVPKNTKNGRVYIQRAGSSDRFYLYNVWLE